MARKFTYEEVKNFVEIDCNSWMPLKLITTTYKNNKTKLTLQDSEEYLYFASLDMIQSNMRKGLKLRVFDKNNIYTIYNIKTWLKKNAKGYDLLSENYTYLKDKLKFKCPNNHIFYMDFHHFKNAKNRCPECAGFYKDTNKYKNQIEEQFKGKYTILGEYKKANIHVKTKCNDCGYIWEVRPSNLIRGFGCPNCAKSKGEQRIRNFLILNNINIKEQYRIKDCKNKRPLPFDFAVLNDYNNEILLIEYDGELHFKPAKYDSRGKQKLLQQQQNDQIKTQYCEDNNIPLLRIPYWEFDNIEQILEEWLIKHGVIHKN